MSSDAARALLLAVGDMRMHVHGAPIRLGRRPTRDPDWPALTGHVIPFGGRDPSVSRNAVELRPDAPGWRVHNPSLRSPITLAAARLGEMHIPPGVSVTLPTGSSVVRVPGQFGPYDITLHIAGRDHGASNQTLPGDTTMGPPDPDPVLRHWLAARFGAFLRPESGPPRVRSTNDAYADFTTALGTATSRKGLVRREEKLREAMAGISHGVTGRENVRRFVNELVQRGMLTVQDVDVFRHLLEVGRRDVT